MIDGGRRWFWLQLGQSLKIRLILRFVRRWPDRLRRRRLLDGRKRYCRPAGVQDDFFRPFVRRLDPDNRSVSGDRLIGKHRRRRWQTPSGDEQQSDERASDEHKIPRYGHRLSLLQIEQCRFAQNRDASLLARDRFLHRYAAEALRFCRAKQRLN
jgi:hypothetical protein